TTTGCKAPDPARNVHFLDLATQKTDVLTLDTAPCDKSGARTPATIRAMAIHYVARRHKEFIPHVSASASTLGHSVLLPSDRSSSDGGHEARRLQQQREPAVR